MFLAGIYTYYKILTAACSADISAWKTVLWSGGFIDLLLPKNSKNSPSHVATFRWYLKHSALVLKSFHSYHDGTSPQLPLFHFHFIKKVKCNYSSWLNCTSNCHFNRIQRWLMNNFYSPEPHTLFIYISIQKKIRLVTHDIFMKIRVDMGEGKSLSNLFFEDQSP